MYSAPIGFIPPTLFLIVIYSIIQRRSPNLQKYQQLAPVVHNSRRIRQKNPLRRLQNILSEHRFQYKNIRFTSCLLFPFLSLTLGHRCPQRFCTYVNGRRRCSALYLPGAFTVKFWQPCAVYGRLFCVKELASTESRAFFYSHWSLATEPSSMTSFGAGDRLDYDLTPLAGLTVASRAICFLLPSQCLFLCFRLSAHAADRSPRFMYFGCFCRLPRRCHRMVIMPIITIDQQVAGACANRVRIKSLFFFYYLYLCKNVGYQGAIFNLKISSLCQAHGWYV